MLTFPENFIKIHNFLSCFSNKQINAGYHITSIVEVNRILCPFTINILSLEYLILARKENTGTEVSDSFVEFLNMIKGVCHRHHPHTCVLQVKEAQLVSLQTPLSWRESCTTHH